MNTVLRIGNYDISEVGRGNSSCCQNIPSPALLQAPSLAVIADAIKRVLPLQILARQQDMPCITVSIMLCTDMKIFRPSMLRE